MIGEPGGTRTRDPKIKSSDLIRKIAVDIYVFPMDRFPIADLVGLSPYRRHGFGNQPPALSLSGSPPAGRLKSRQGDRFLSDRREGRTDVHLPKAS